MDIDLTGVADLLSLQVVLNYDAQVLTLANVASLLPGTFSWATSEPTPGTVLFSAASAYALQQDAPAVRLTFIVGTGFTSMLTSYVEPSSVIVDEVDMTGFATHGILTLTPSLATGLLNAAANTGGVAIHPNDSKDLPQATTKGGMLYAFSLP